MILTMILLFVVGYAFIALEHKVKVDKSAIALLMCGAIWTIFSLLGHDANIGHDMVDHLGDTCEILVFLIGAAHQQCDGRFVDLNFVLQRDEGVADHEEQDHCQDHILSY